MTDSPKKKLFCASIQCMDGRIDDAISAFIHDHYGFQHVDRITEPGPNGILARQENRQLVDSILNRLKISVSAHGTDTVFVSGHFDCAGHPVDEQRQIEDIFAAIEFMKTVQPDLKYEGLWVNKDWQVEWLHRPFHRRTTAADFAGQVHIRPAALRDAEEIAEIYNHYVRHSVVTFEEQPVSVDEMKQRIEGGLASGYPWFAATVGDRLIGFAYASQWKSRSAYRESCETTIYLDEEFIGQGIGLHLYAILLNELWTRGFHTAIGGISLPNQASVAMHEKLGFKSVGTFVQVGYKLGRRIDVGYWQILNPKKEK